VAVGNYPPAQHVLVDLAIEIDASDPQAAVARLPVSPQVTAADGGVHLGVIATLVDMVGGAIAMRALHPDWMATADMSVQTMRPSCGPVLEARATVLRRGRTTLVVEVFVYDGTGETTPVAWSTLTFAVLPRNDGALIDDLSTVPATSSFGSGHLEDHVLNLVSIGDDQDTGGVSMPVVDYVRNSFGALQGGMVALLGEVAGARAVASALAPALGTDRPVSAVDLQIAYLATSRVGPIVTSVRSVSTDPVVGSGRAVMELRDTGANHRLTTVISVGALMAS
jgi:uncharacterized protein (TIGR00369 family)